VTAAAAAAAAAASGGVGLGLGTAFLWQHCQLAGRGMCAGQLQGQHVGHCLCPSCARALPSNASSNRPLLLLLLLLLSTLSTPTHRG
jgi:hypothetical protein